MRSERVDFACVRQAAIAFDGQIKLAACAANEIAETKPSTDLW